MRLRNTLLPTLALLAGISVPAVGQTTSSKPVPLFDGETLDGWVTSDGKPVTRGWKVTDGTIHRESRGGNILYEREVDDFELAFEWKIVEGGNLIFCF